MKQTNNAIKFLMAQYRAIFRNANLKMFLAAATAAAALAAGQAQAAAFDNKVFDAATTEVNIDGQSTGAPSYDNIALANGDKDSGKGFNIKVSAGGANNTIKAVVDFSTSDITVAGSSADAKLTIQKGDAAAANVKLKSLTVADQGELDVTGDAGSGTVVTASTLSFGNGKDATQAVVKIDGHSTVIAGALSKNVEPNADVGKLTINKATVTVSGGGTLTGNNIQITDGAITLGGGAGAGALGTVATDAVPATSSITMDSGSITVAKTTSGSVTASTITLNGGALNTTGELKINAGTKFSAQGGTVDVQKDGSESGSLIIAGAADFGAKSKIVNSGSITLKGATTIESESIEVAADSILKIDGTDPTASLTVSAAALEKFKKGAIHSVDGKTATIVFIDSTDLGNKELVLKNDGTIDTAKYVANNGFFRFEGAEASFSGSGDLNAKATFAFDTLKLGKDGVLTLKGGADLIVGKSLAVNGDGAGITVENGTIELNGTSGSVDAKAINLNGKTATPAKLKVTSGTWGVKDLTLTSGDALVDNQSTLTAVNVDLKAGAIEVKKGSTLNVTGNLSTTASAGSIKADASHINTISGGTVSLGAAGVDLQNASDIKLEVVDFQKEEGGKKVFDPTKLTSAITGSVNSTITIMDGDKKLSLDATQFDALQSAVGAGFKGLFDVQVSGIEDAKDGMSLDLVKDKVSAEEYKAISATHDATKDFSGNKSVGSVELSGGSTLNMKADGAALGLFNAKDGKFVYTKDANGNTTAAGVTFQGAANSLTLAGSGEIGAITNTHTANAGALTIGTAEKAGTVTVKGGIGAKEANKGVESVTVNANSHLNVDGGVYTDNLDMRQGTSLNAKDGKGDVIVAGTATILGSIDAGTLDLSGTGSIKHSIAGDSVIDVTNLKLAGSNILIVGTDGDKDGKGSTTASVFADTLTMGAGSSLFVDPHSSKAAAFVVVDDIKNTAGTSSVDGAIYVGQNAGLGYGFADEQDFMDVVGGYLNDHGAFGNGEKDVKNALVLNKPLTVAKDNGIVVNASLKESDITPALDTKYQNTLSLGAGSALVLTDEAFTGTGAAITFGKSSETVATAKVNVDPSASIKLVGDFTAKTPALKFFAANNNGTPGTVTLSQDIKVSAAGGLLEGTIKQNYTDVQLTTVKGYDDIARAGVSAPVGQVFIDYVDGNLKYVKDSVGHGFLIDSMQSAEGRKQFDAAAHAATYAGAQQAAVAAVGTMAGAVGGRVGSMGVEAATITATGSQANGGVWLAPMYQSVDADGFNAEGASYGADVDLAGVAFGADTVNGNMRFGAVFNIGSGDADGKGNGAGLKDEFDYYGIGIYSVMGFGQLAIVGDASLNVISHEVEGLEAKGEADTTAVTMGVTGQYTISNPMVDVTPHLGARFIRLDTDSYDLTVGGKTLATTDFDVQNVFSIPLGVTLSKAFEMGGWSLAPSADLSITFNTGDTEAKSNTRFNGINTNLGLTTEVLDEVTYGVAVGLGAQYGSFGTQIGINYTGSENTDSFGVNANARYMF